MYISTLVDDVQKVVEQLRADRGNFVLAMLYSRGGEEVETGWNLIVSAAWTDQTGRAEAIQIVTLALSESLGLENKQSISRVTVLPTKDSFVRDLTSRFQVSSPGSGLWIRNDSAGGIPIGSGFIFYSVRT